MGYITFQLPWTVSRLFPVTSPIVHITTGLHPSISEHGGRRFQVSFQRCCDVSGVHGWLSFTSLTFSGINSFDCGSSQPLQHSSFLSSASWRGICGLFPACDFIVSLHIVSHLVSLAGALFSTPVWHSSWTVPTHNLGRLGTWWTKPYVIQIAPGFGHGLWVRASDTRLGVRSGAGTLAMEREFYFNLFLQACRGKQAMEGQMKKEKNREKPGKKIETLGTKK